MIRLKTEKQIDGIRKSCKMLSAMYRELIPLVKPGAQTIEIDRWAQDWIRRAGGKPAFLGVGKPSNPFPAALCISINDEVIHGIPSKRKIRAGDLVGLDCGIDLGGYISDQALSLEMGRASEKISSLNATTCECLYRAIAAVRSGHRFSAIAKAVDSHARARGYGVVREYCGHGVGLELHEEPQVPNSPRSGGPNPRMGNGMVFAIEPMVNLGTANVELAADGWTVLTADGSISAHWEHTVAIFGDKVEILTDPLESFCGK